MCGTIVLLVMSISGILVLFIIHVLYYSLIHCAGVRLYFTTTPDGQQGRPVLLAMVHARLPPGFSPSSTMLKPGNTIHLAHYRRGCV